MKIALNCDGVLLDFYRHICNYLDMPLVKVDDWHVPWILQKFDEIRNDVEFWSTIPVLTTPKEICFDFDCYITAIPDGMKAARMRNLHELGFPNKPVYVTHDKADLCIELGIDVLIDDKPETIDECRLKGIHAIFFKPWYFKHDYRVDLGPAHNFAEVRKQLAIADYRGKLRDVLNQHIGKPNTNAVLELMHAQSFTLSKEVNALVQANYFAKSIETEARINLDKDGKSI